MRTAYFNGQYTNQYAQSKFTGHIPFRRFTITAPHSPPVFADGAVMPQNSKELERIGEEAPEETETFELEDTAVRPEKGIPVRMPLKAALDMASPEPRNSAQLPHRQVQKRLPPPQKPLPPVPLPTRLTSSTKTIRQKASSPHCSILCDEDEAIFPTRKWSKPLAEMGDAFNWKLSVLNRFNAIQY